MKRVWTLPRNDVEAAVAWVREHLSTYGAPPHPDDMAVVIQLQDDPEELERRLAEFLPGAQPAPMPLTSRDQLQAAFDARDDALERLGERAQQALERTTCALCGKPVLGAHPFKLRSPDGVACDDCVVNRLPGPGGGGTVRLE